MRVLIVGPIHAGDSIIKEIEAYRAAGHTVDINTRTLEDRGESLRARFAADASVAFLDFDPANPSALIEAVSKGNAGYDAIIYPAGTQGFTPAVFDAARDDKLAHTLKFIGCPNDAVSHLAGITEKANEAGVPILHTPGIHAPAVAEYTIAQLAYHTRGFDLFYDETGKQGAWPHEKAITQSHALAGKTIGVLGGSGNDGAAVIAHALANGMHVIAMGSGRAESDEKIRSMGAEVATSIDDLCQRADFISVNCRKNQDTIGLIGEEQMQKMKPGVIIINPAGAEIIDKQALMKRFEEPSSKRTMTVILDMPYGGRRDKDAFNADPDNAVLKAKGVLFTPRMAGYTAETRADAVKWLTNDMTHVMAGDCRVTIANNPKGFARSSGLLADAEIPQLLDELMDLMQKAGVDAMRMNKEGALETVYKKDGSPTTRADRMASDNIQKGLERKGYGFRFSGEELLADAANASNVEVIIDGIDGTRNFRDGNYGWCISVAIKRDEETVLAAIHDPKCGETFFAVKGQGAFHRDRFGTEPLQTPPTLPDDFSFSIGSFRIKGSTVIKQNIIEGIKTMGGREREWGSVALSICGVARGGMGVFVQGNSYLHDHIAGLLIAEEAGSAVINMPSIEAGRSDIIVVHSTLRDRVDAVYKQAVAGLEALVVPAKKHAEDTGTGTGTSDKQGGRG